jgi:flagellar biosynthesis protein FlhF
MLEPSPDPTDVRRFTAGSLSQALEQVRAELGSDAVILATRQVRRPWWKLWKRERRLIEVTAGAGALTPTRFLSRPATAAPTPDEPRAEERPLDRFSQPRQPVLTGGSRKSTGTVSVPAPVAAEIAAGQAAMSRQLVSIQNMVESLSRQRSIRPGEPSQEQFEIFSRLIDAEVDDELARELVGRLAQHPPSENTFDAALPRLRELLEEGIPCTAPLAAAPGRRRVVALVGPTGVGKTTTIAKLAANLRLRDGVRLGLVTVDTFRIAAVEQLRTYAQIIDLPMKVVATPREMRRALDELAGLDLVLIDTAGRSPRDELRIQELGLLLQEAQVDEVHLVLSLSASLRSLQTTAAQFSSAGATSLILTKLDEALGMGMLASLARRIPLPISYLTTGQEVPDDIEPASAKRIARLVLGEEFVNPRLRTAA